MYLAKGMTLLELMVVLVIIVILALVATPSYEAFLQRERHSKAVNGLQSVFMYARSEAVKRETAITLSWNPETKSLKVLDSSNELRRFSLPETATNIAISGLSTIGIGVSGRVTTGTPQPWRIMDNKGFATTKCITILVSGQLTIGACA